MWVRLSVALAAVACLTVMAVGGSGSVQVLHDGTFQERIRDGPWLIVFSSSWCSTCKVLAPIIDQVARDPRLVQIGVKVGKVDVQTDPSTAGDEHVDEIPTIIFYGASSNIRVRYRGSLDDIVVNGGGSESDRKALSDSLVAFVQQQHVRHANNPPRSSFARPAAGANGPIDNDLVSRMRSLAQMMAKENLAVYTAITYALGLAQGLFVGVLYRIAVI